MSMDPKKSNNSPKTRRDFLKMGATGLGVAVAGGALNALNVGPASAAKPMPDKWDVECDVLVIGSGYAALSAAYEAHQAGAEVIIIEKMKVAGGNSIINGGLLAAPGTPLQKKEGIKDSPAIYLADMLKAGLSMNHVDLARIVAEQVNDALMWTINDIGVEYKTRLNHLGGHSVPRTYNTTNSSGSGIVRPLLDKVKELGIPLKTRHKMEALFHDDTGRIQGVEVRTKYKHGKETSGKIKNYRARRGVILATGGFSKDEPFRKAQDPRLAAEFNVDSTNQPGATSEAMVEAMRIGANPVHLSWIQLGPWASADEQGFGVGSMFSILAGFPFGFMVDADTGKRFVNELADRKTRADIMLTRKRPPVVITDENGVQFASTLPQCLERGVVKKYDTLEEIASANDIPMSELKKTFGEYNGFVKKGEDVQFGKRFREGHKELKAPFYAIRLWPKVHHCMGGLQIDTESRVIRNETWEPIPGLYAAGEVTSGIHGASRLGSCAIADCLVFGRIAGKAAARG